MGVMDPMEDDCETVSINWYRRTCTYLEGSLLYCTEWEYAFTTQGVYCDPNNGGGGGGNNNEGYIEDEVQEPLSNQDIIDSLRGYPCAQEILRQLPSITEEVDSLIQKIFGINDDINLKFSIDNSLDQNSPVDGTEGSKPGEDYFFGFIKLNPWVLKNATKEYILTTLLHESIHAYIDYWKYKLNAGIIDTSEFKNRFPIFYEYNRILSDNEIAQHNEMANNYINTMKEAINCYNLNSSDVGAEALAWGGLQHTTSWKLRSDTNAIKEINLNCRNAGLNKFSQYNFEKCDGILPQ